MKPHLRVRIIGTGILVGIIAALEVTMAGSIGPFEAAGMAMLAVFIGAAITRPDSIPQASRQEHQRD